MSGCYVSPLPTVIGPNFANRDAEGVAITERMHLWASPAGEMRCNPRLCRECWREHNWHDHGPVARAGIT